MKKMMIAQRIIPKPSGGFPYSCLEGQYGTDFECAQLFSFCEKKTIFFEIGKMLQLKKIKCFWENCLHAYILY